MKKLTLELDALRVESFEALVPQTEAGTVHGNENQAVTWASVCRPCINSDQPSCTC